MAEEILKFETQEGVTGLKVEWGALDCDCTSDEWADKYGSRIGSGTAPLPNGGWVDMEQFAAVLIE